MIQLKMLSRTKDVSLKPVKKVEPLKKITLMLCDVLNLDSIWNQKKVLRIKILLMRSSMITICSIWWNKSGKKVKILLVVVISKIKIETYVLQMLLQDKHGRIIMKIIWIPNKKLRHCSSNWKHEKLQICWSIWNHQQNVEFITRNQ